MARRPKRKRRGEQSLVMANLWVTDILHIYAATFDSDDNPDCAIRSRTDLETAWQANREAMLLPWSSLNHIGHRPGYRPLCWWMFDAEFPPQEAETQYECLERQELLTVAELEHFARIRYEESSQERERRLCRELRKAAQAAQAFTRNPRNRSEKKS